MPQRFGGPWSLIKIDMLGKYMRFFNTALKNAPFERVYIDAFAGSGAFRYAAGTPAPSLFDTGQDDDSAIHAGSAKLALESAPPFNRIFFIEQNRVNVGALQRLINSSRHPNAAVLHGEANEILRELCHPGKWRNRRGIIFLDPFGMSVEWSTLQMIAATKALDVWFLFALAGTVRNLPRLASRLDHDKEAAVTRILGTAEWFEKFYAAPAPRTDLWGSTTNEPIRRSATIDDIESYVRNRLSTIFPHVESPKRLKAPKNMSLFSLFFAMSNPDEKAITLARKGAQHILINT